MNKKLPIGLSDFKKIIEEDYYYIDKTIFIKDIIKSSSEILLFPRPRRFGKTLNLSMLRYFFEKTDKDTSRLFKGLEIEKEKTLKNCQGKYPVIYITFKDVKHLNWQHCMSSLKSVIYDEFARHRYLMEGDILFNEEKMYFHQVIEDNLPDAKYQNALKKLSMYLERFYNSPVIILIDEYDTPIHTGYSSGYYEQIISFMRNFLSSGLKDNPYLFKGVLTGILRVAKESVFSGLNNLGVYSILDKDFKTSFGFTEPEVINLLKEYNLSDRYEDAASWYNGYVFGGETIYNPWSILQLTHRNPKFPFPYWVNTADTGMIDRLATNGGRELKEEIGLLLEDNTISKEIYDSIVLKDLETQDDLLWSFLLFSGYLKAVKQTGSQTWEIKIPNKEVKVIYHNMVRKWFGEKIKSSRVETLINSLVKGNIDDFEYILSDIVEKVLSFHDTGGTEPEQFYHAFVLGLLVWLEDQYEVKSNRESGLGRYDVVLIPKDRTKKGIILELKKVNKRKNETPEQTLKRAMEQIEKKKYAAELEAGGVKDIIKIAIAFKGKKLWIDHDSNEQIEKG